MKVLNRFLVLSLLVFGFAMMGCSQKENRKTRSNVVRPLDPSSANIQNQLDQQGLAMIVQSMDRAVTQSYYQVETKVSLGNSSGIIGFRHSYEQTETYQGQIGGFQYYATSFCYFSTQCQDYIVMIDVYMNSTLLYQVGLYKNFNNHDPNTNTVYKVVSGNSSVSFDTMVNYLTGYYY